MVGNSPGAWALDPAAEGATFVCVRGCRICHLADKSPPRRSAAGLKLLKRRCGKRLGRSDRIVGDSEVAPKHHPKKAALNSAGRRARQPRAGLPVVLRHWSSPAFRLIQPSLTAMDSIREELTWWRAELEKQGKQIEAQRLYQRTMFDLEMMKEIGYCHGIENYSRHFSGRLPGEAPPTLLDYLPHDAIMFLDESHQTVPQLHGMYHGNALARKFWSRTASASPARSITDRKSTRLNS